MKKSFFAFIFLCFLSIFASSCTLPHASSYAYVHSPVARQEDPRIVQKIWIDNSFGEADMVEIQNALDRWTFALNGYMTFETEEFDYANSSLEPLGEAYAGKAWAIIKINRTSRDLIDRDHPDKGTITTAFCDRVGGHLMYIVRDRMKNEEVRGIVMHELGHLLGASHINESGDLMAPIVTISDSKCVDRHTLEQVAKYQGFPVENMNYCVYTTMDSQAHFNTD